MRVSCACHFAKKEFASNLLLAPLVGPVASRPVPTASSVALVLLSLSSSWSEMSVIGDEAPDSKPESSSACAVSSDNMAIVSALI